VVGGENRFLPPICPLAAAAACAFYSLFASGLPLRALSAIALLLTIVCGVFATGDRLRSCALAVAFGLAIGANGSTRVGFADLPPASLIAPGAVSGATVLLLNDPAPTRFGVYRVDARVLEFRDRGGARYGASGRLSVTVPAALASSWLPGGIGAGEPLALGRVVGFEGRLALDSTGRSVFRAKAFDRSVSQRRRWASRLHELRARLRLSFDRVLYDWGEAGGFLIALASADRAFLSPSVSDAFLRSGLAHVLALSGTHLSVIALVFVFLGRAIGQRARAANVALLGMVAFVAFAGPSPSLTRSLLMAALFFLMGRLSVRARPFPILALAFCLQLALFPLDARSLGFVLSYAALAGILLAGEWIDDLSRPYLGAGASSALSASLSAQLATAPVTAGVFGSVSAIGAAATLVVAPLASVYLVAGFVSFAIAAVFPSLSPVVRVPMQILYGCIKASASFFAHWAPLSIGGSLGTIAVAAVSAMAFAGLAFADRLARRWRNLDAQPARL